LAYLVNNFQYKEQTRVLCALSASFKCCKLGALAPRADEGLDFHARYGRATLCD